MWEGREGEREGGREGGEKGREREQVSPDKWQFAAPSVGLSQDQQ